ncbi:Soluble epoxide hydrolase [Corynebacterium atrinae]|uniref:alpha/beta fold hydrolase n=1 Tax=Corynebacterium atrinae TaxID=1336740 RepID=UPI0025B54A9C|nr:alpha/beta hydrolase [Corynebacterium atrinae]WJY62361.1 Soluble epoxide hydrolase [Corynebacterium atrinae]
MLKRIKRPKRQPVSPSVVELEGPYTHELVHTRGLRLHAAVAGDPSHPLIVLLHGSFGGWFDFREVIAPLAAAGFHVAAVDARGYGMSDKPPATAADDLRTATGDIAGLIQALGHQDAAVVGADTGGTVAWMLATSYPERVRTVISVCAAHPTDLRRSIAARPWNYPWLIARNIVFRVPALALMRPPWVMDQVFQRNLQLSTAGEFHSTAAFEQILQLRQLASRIGNSRPAFVRNNRLLLSSVPARSLGDRVTAPALLIEPTRRAWRHLSARSRARVAGAVEVRRIEGTKYLPHIENPRAFTETVVDFLRRRA